MVNAGVLYRRICDKSLCNRMRLPFISNNEILIVIGKVICPDLDHVRAGRRNVPMQCNNITKTRLFKYTENFTSKKWKKKSDKKILIFFIFLLKI